MTIWFGAVAVTLRSTVSRGHSMKPTEKIVAFPRSREVRMREERAFLPAALEIVETPPSPIGRLGGVVIVAFFGLAVAWACFGSVDIVASAQGKIIPSVRTKVIQPFETGVVRTIRVHDGQIVKAGEVLVELDPTMNEAERDHLQSDFVAVRLDSARLRAGLTENADPLTEFNPPEDASEALVEMQRQYLIGQTGEQRAKLAVLDNQEAQKLAERTSVAATIEKFESVIPFMQERTDIRKALLKHELVSKLTYLETLQTLVEAQKELKVQQSRLKEAEATLAAIKEEKEQAKAEFRHKLSGDLAEAERKATGLGHDLAKAEQRTKFQSLTAPVDGVVQQLAIHTVGGVVSYTQESLRER
jgi:hemolysin D